MLSLRSESPLTRVNSTARKTASTIPSPTLIHRPPSIGLTYVVNDTDENDDSDDDHDYDDNYDDDNDDDDQALL